jgi:sigma-E factor negative regulatory protein RseB
MKNISAFLHRLLCSVSLSVVGCMLLTSPVHAQAERSVHEWLSIMHEGGRKKTYLGTYVVTTNQGTSSARIWHVCDGTQQMERVDVLSGAPRTTIRHNDQVVVYTPHDKVAVVEKRESLGLFSDILRTAAIPEHYVAKLMHTDRVAGLETQVLELKSRDSWRFSLRAWVEKASGLVIKLQTLDLGGQVLEESAFSEIDLRAPVKMENLAKQMKTNTDESRGVKVIRPDVVKTEAAALGWTSRAAVPGFKPVSCIQRKAAQSSQPEVMQWVFSDGLATFSIFAQPFDARRHGVEMMAQSGATQIYGRKLQGWWLTLMGDVPMATLKAYSDGLDFKK